MAGPSVLLLAICTLVAPLALGDPGVQSTGARQPDDADDILRGVVTWDAIPDERLRRAFSLYGSKPDVASSLCQDILAGPDPDGRAHVILAVVHHAKGRFALALDHALAALEHYPRDVNLACVAAEVYARRGDRTRGDALLQRASRRAGDPVQVATCFAVYYSYANRTEEATRAYEYALARIGCALDRGSAPDPVPPPAAFPEAGAVPRPWRDAEAAPYARSVARKLRFNLGNLYKRAKRLELARATFERVLRDSPRYVSALINLSGVVGELGDYDRAFLLLHNATALDPSRAGAWYNLGLNLERQSNHTAALAAFRRAVAADPHYADARRNLAAVLRTLGRHGDARREYHAALALPRGVLSQCERAVALMHIATLMLRPVAESGARGRLAMALLDRKHRALLALPRPPDLGHRLVKLVAGLGNFFAPYMSVNARRSQRSYARIIGRLAPGIRVLAPHLAGPPPPPAPGAACGRCPAPGRALRVGFLSMQLRQHSVGKLINGVLIRLAARPDVNVTALFLHQDRRKRPADAISTRIRERAALAVDLSHNLTVAAGQLADLGLDVLVFADVGLDALSYFLAFGRFAPVQLQFLFGHPVTAATPGIDAVVSSLHFERIGAAEHYSEHLLRLDSSSTFYWNPRVPLVRRPEHWGMARDAHRYACLQSLFKIHPTMDGVFARILAADPKAVILFLQDSAEAWERALRARMRRHPVLRAHSERILFFGRQSHEDYMQLVGTAHVAVDVWPMAGGITSFEALAMGVPVVALPAAVSQACYLRAMYRALRMTEFLLAPTADAVADRAVRVATSPALRRILSRHILTHADRLFEDERVPRQWAAALWRFARDPRWMDRAFRGHLLPANASRLDP